MRFTKRTDYALRLLIALAQRSGAAVPTREIALSEGLSLKFLQSVVSQLAEAGLVESTTGARGGHRLRKDASKISVLDVVEAVEGPMSLMDCMEESGQCGLFHGCRIHSLLGRAQFAMNEVLAGSSVADLVVCPAHKS